MDLVYAIAWVSCVLVCWRDCARVAPAAPPAASPPPSAVAVTPPQFDIEKARKQMRESVQKALNGNGCTCDLCTQLRERPELALDSRWIRALQEAVVAVATGRVNAAITCVDGASPRGLLSLRIVCVSTEVSEAMIEPVLVREFGQEWRERA